MPETSSSSPTKGPVVCVFCGSSPGKSPAHLEAARELGRTFHERGIQLVYGAGTVGIMGELARSLVALSGPEAAHGVIPDALIQFERKNSGGATTSDAGASAAFPSSLTEFGRTTVVPNMHTRKQLMAQLVLAGGPGSGFVALSGGYGTIEELMEVTTWNQLGIHDRGVVIYNVNGFWDPLLRWISQAVEEGFINTQSGGIIVEARSALEVVEFLRDYKNAEGRFKLNWSTAET